MGRLRAEAGSRPGGRPPFLSRDKQGGKETRPTVCDPFAQRRGKPVSVRLRGAPRNSLRAGALRSNKRGESVHEACARGRACSPRKRPAAGAARRGFEDRNPHGPSLRSPLHSRAQAPRAAQARPSKAMARAAVWTFPAPSVCAEERRARGGGCAAGHTRFVI